MNPVSFNAAQSDLLDLDESKLQLQNFVVSAKEHSPEDQLVTLRQRTNLCGRMKGILCGTPPRIQLGVVKGNDVEECVFRLQGFFVDASLPPYLNVHGLPDNLTYLYQSIRIHGHDLDYFESAVESMRHISMVLTQAVPSGLLDTDVIDQFAYYGLVEFSNLLLCPSNLVTPIDVIDISNTVDPQCILRKKKRHWLVHTPDNVVHYMKLLRQPSGGDSTCHTATCFPHSIRPGNLVELEISFGAVRSHKGGHKLLCMLRSILILEEELAMNAWLKHSMTSTSLYVKTLKRKDRAISNDEDDREMKRVVTSVSRMNLDGPEDSL
ncbi:hypothetical protein JAAARDRAFT_200871 [Jaapia argillacea MUCL 33604]|uniref:Uncharacterized protein n=1 Tax=Jaapia argillacea MUCL 33604 TaxID=933084 RepID=A0A067PEL9_9AGAM|nr:hypothetical protein JAAARDRAFT_200871 [Jaapia argillacea MUCL 33604]